MVKKGHKLRSNYKSEGDVKNEGERVAKYANAKFFKSNPLHFDIFDGVCQIEAEVIQMCVDLYRGNDEQVGVIDTSEADCVRNAVLAYREWAKDKKGITKPNIVAPNTFEPSLDRACELMDIELRRVPMGDDVRVGKVY